jgi:hypothetical protein
MICYGVLIGFVMLVILARIMEHRDKKKLRVAQQGALYPNLQSVRVTVDASTYSKTEDRDVVRVYYQPDSPMTFMLEEELE